MAQNRSRRGRPKGSGIDDRARLLEIAHLIAANPALKPTTAIKSLGIEDPSMIRRLRDKFHAARIDLERLMQAERTTQAQPAIQRHARAEPAGRPNLRLVSSNPAAAEAAPPPIVHPSQSSPVIRNPELCVPAAASAVEQPRAPKVVDDLGPMAAWFGLGVVAAASAIEQQLTLSQQLIRLPAVASLLRQQVQMAELMLALTAAGRSSAGSTTV